MSWRRGCVEAALDQRVTLVPAFDQEIGVIPVEHQRRSAIADPPRVRVVPDEVIAMIANTFKEERIPSTFNWEFSWKGQRIGLGIARSRPREGRNVRGGLALF